MKKLIVVSIVILLFISCNNEENIVGNDNSGFALSGKIINWDLGEGKIIEFVPLRGSGGGPDPIYTGNFGNCVISTDGSFSILLKAPPEDFFTVSSQKNCGLLGQDSSLSYIKDAAVVFLSVIDNNSMFLGDVIYSNRSRFFFDDSSNIGDFFMGLEWIDRDYNFQKTIVYSDSLDGQLFTQTIIYDLQLKKGWNKYFVKLLGLGTDFRTTSITLTEPSGGKWYYLH
ncbi:MAG: hypothetical protein K9I71_11330 [Ignavibacteriales bacterium]|nr:hypothetical protein [Ignavibacteriales bacterium]MCF8316713.1 hypothetical protein [Ignavibacteriales bacterium]MCF8436053.1 hypothetical protein [Ignavibacteriales bacterium]